MRRTFLAFLTIFLLGPLGLAHAQTLTLEDSTEKAIGYLSELKQASSDVKIAGATLREHLAANSIMLRLKSSSEYTRDLRSGSGVIAINNTALGSTTQYQDSTAFVLTMPLYYYDLVDKKRVYDLSDMLIKDINYKILKKNIRVAVLNNYVDALLISRERASKKEQLTYYKELFKLKQRLNTAGTLSRIEVADQAVVIAGLLNDLDALELKFASSMADLSRLTGEQYNVDQLLIKDITEPVGRVVSTANDYADDLEYKSAQLEIDKKKQELDLELKDNWPKLDGYAQYVFYGASPTNLFSAAKNLQSTNINIGISTAFTLYDGFYNAAKIERIKLELENLELKKEQCKQNKAADLEKLRVLSAAFERNRNSGKEQSRKISEKGQLVDRLNQERISDSLQSLQIKIDNAMTAYELEKNRINDLRAIKRQLITLEGDG